MAMTPTRLLTLAATFALAAVAMADDDPIHERQELMESVRDAVKPVGLMLRGEAGYDEAVVRASLETWRSVGARFGSLFPAGSETGQDTEAAPAIWEDREGFGEALATFRDATDRAIAADLQTLDEAKPVLSPVLQACKNCHDTYRIED